MVTSSTILVALLNGLATGMLLFITAVGLTLVFGVLGVLNFAHGSFYMFGAYFTFFLVSGQLIGVFDNLFWPALVGGALIVAVVGGVVERLVIRPIYDEEHTAQLLLTFALVLVLDNGARLLWGTQFRSVEVPPLLNFPFEVLGRTFPAYNLFLIVAGGIVAVLMWFTFTRTKAGRTVRAAAEDRETADALGVNVPALYTLVFVVGCALAGLAGGLAAPFRAISPEMGTNIIIDAFIVVVIGGLGSFPGALLAAVLLGLVNSFAFIYLPQFQTLIPFILMAVVLLMRPQGLLGEAA